MTYSWDAILSHVASRLSEASGAKIESKDLAPPPKSELGEVAFGCFALAKAKGKNPIDIAKELAKKLSKSDHTIESASAAGPYVNIKLQPGDFISRIVQDAENNGEEFGASDQGQGKQLMLEYAQPNTHKEIHVGHLRNLVLGAALARILKAAGWKVVTSSYHGDIGAHVAKCLWFFVRSNASHVKQEPPKRKKKSETFKPLSEAEWPDYLLQNLSAEAAEAILNAVPKEQRNGKYLGELYTEAGKILEENPDWKDQVSAVQRELEASAPGWAKLWQETRRWSVAEMNQIFTDFGVKLDRPYFESEVQEDGQRIVDELLKNGIAKKSEGAIVVDLESQKLGIFLIRKSDGTALYATKDLPLAKLKFKEYPKLERSLMVVDTRQDLYFRQLFATLRLMGFTKSMEHIGYEFVTLKSGAMSSREGNIVTLQSFRDEVMKFAAAETLKRHPDWNQGRITHTSWCLMMGGVKFGMLRQDNDKIFIFDLEKALSFDGDTGPYVQYAATRLRSILKKSGWEKDKLEAAGDLSLLGEPAEKNLALQIAIFPAACKKAAQELRPMVIAQWCLQAAQKVTQFYHDVPVLEAPFGVKEARLRLVAAMQSVIKQGLDLLGIPLPDEM